MVKQKSSYFRLQNIDNYTAFIVTFSTDLFFPIKKLIFLISYNHLYILPLEINGSLVLIN